MAEDARPFEQDTGAQVLHVGFPLFHLPPNAKDARGFASTKRVLAPIAFIPVRLTLKKGRTPGLELESAADGAERVMPNTALLAWVERQTGKRLGELFADEEGQEPWRELNELSTAVATALELPAPAPFIPETLLSPTPRSEDESAASAAILPCAVLGLYPLSNQSLVDDMRAFVDGEPVQGPIESFLRVGVSLGAQGTPRKDAAAQGTWRAGEDRLVSHADPCQARAVWARAQQPGPRRPRASRHRQVADHRQRHWRPPRARRAGPPRLRQAHRARCGEAPARTRRTNEGPVEICTSAALSSELRSGSSRRRETNLAARFGLGFSRSMSKEERVSFV
ncbi:DUF4011 domain-containing protein [Archangium sp.]|uniref:DUF4011 domain-containing protein n=1 Tax=Archangium sp. TaxID=1872627 RepID=UPI002D6F5985|nr:DUF4011 domain-containing protein [Archangium sp.]HYO55305.1 DUF4011 domain-containing protein [Archangium sp.]